MKKMIASLLLLTFVFAANSQTTYTVAKGSTIHWLGKKTTGQHEGDVTLKSGSLQFDAAGTTPLKGEFVLDMPSMTSTDIKDADDNKKLMEHLKGEEFFDVKGFPTAVLTVKKFAPLTGNKDANYTVTADLTIKGVKNEITFPAKIEFLKTDIKAKATIVIDRTKWKIVYKSKSIFPTLGDKFIYDDMTFTVDLFLNK
ncbi:MAG: lipid-binding protein [Bacteroidota bacterium]|nr:lipid-binding protein [Bacteroidota bacterium]